MEKKIKTLQIEESKAKSIYKMASAELKIMLEDTFGKDFFSKKITERIKTYEDACAILGIEPIADEVLLKLSFTKDEIAYRKLKTITEALNEGWLPDWTNSNQYKYWPWFLYNPNSAGFGYAAASGAASNTNANVGSRLCFKTRELATYAGTQFTDIYNEFLLIK
jgi:hypothetical protein